MIFLKLLNKYFFIIYIFLTTLNVTAYSSPYSKNFLWGAAFSAHQTEGVFGGGEHGDWWNFEHPKEGIPFPIANGDTADLAVDYWHRYSEDYAWAKELGLQSLRTSLAWEKIEPAPGVFSEEVLLHYRAQFQRMQELGIRPMIALHHFTHPQWFHDSGGWLSSESPRIFLRYAEKVLKSLGDLCDLWITFNEPMVLVMMGYLKGEIPPEHLMVSDAFEAAFNIARAHRMVAAMIHNRQGYSPNGRGPHGELRGVGLANALNLYDPENPKNLKDVQGANGVAEISNWAFLRAIQGDRIKFEVPFELPGLPLMERKFPENDLPVWHVGPLMDWVGVNYYTRYTIRYHEKSPLKLEWVIPEGPRGDNGWAIYPEGLERIIRQAAERFPGPFVVTENGLADGDDSRRGKFIQEHLFFLDRVLGGTTLIDLLGYYHWSLMDNFEWLHGYKHRFGLIEIQYDQNLKRVARASAFVYQQEIQLRRNYSVQ